MKLFQLPDAAFLVKFCVFLLGLSGLLTIYSSQTESSEPFYLVFRQLIFFIAGMILLFTAEKIRFEAWLSAAPVLLGISILLLFLLPVFGSRINGMCGWYRLGSWSFQPSEVCRGFYLLGTVMLLQTMSRSKTAFLLQILSIALWLIPIALQPDVGTAAVYAISILLVLFLAGTPLRYLASVIAPALLGSALLIWCNPYMLRRITGFLTPEADPAGSSWHLRQFALTVARGGWTGSKTGMALWSNAYLPFSYNDSAGATMLETLGVLGGLLILIVFITLIFSLKKLAFSGNPAPAAKLFILGCCIFTAVQTFIHMGVNLALLPPTGIVLPFISYGGSSMLGFCLMTGIALAAARGKDDFQI